MSGSCPTYREPFASQLRQGGKTGSVDCTAWALSRVIAHATCGAKVPSGRTCRLQSDEPIPDRFSPGLNLQQVADVARDHYGVYLEVHVGPYALTWKEYEDAREDGRGAIIQGIYAPIADSRYDAGRGFRDTHAIAEDQHATIDSLADGRAPGVWEFDGTLYRRDVMRQFGESLFGRDRIWCALTRDTAPDLVVDIRPKPGNTFRRYRRFHIGANGQVAGTPEIVRTRGIKRQASTAPRAVKWGGRMVFLVQVNEGTHSGEWVARRWSHAA